MDDEAKKQHRILLVDDDKDLLRLLSIRLSGAGYEVITSTSAEEALAQLPVLNPHLVITDLRMGGMDGLALFDHIRKRNTALPVIILTAHGSIPEAVDATQRGVQSFLTKPIDGKALLQEVSKALSLSGAAADQNGIIGDEKWRKEIICRSPAMEALLGKAKLVSMSNSSVLIRGESGTGKELLARAIHQASERAKKPFVPVNCGAIPEPLLESELFGHVKGSFTGAVRNHAGLFLAADGGTILLDEIGDMPLSLQVKLLRVIQERQIRAVGSTASANVDVRIISATHQDLESLVKEGRFREDLYYRLNVVSLEMPSLRQRREDIPLLASHFLQDTARQLKKKISGFAPEAMEILMAAPWPGNIRQLLNVVEHAAVLATTPVISADLVSSTITEEDEKIPSFAEARQKFEQEYLIRLLRFTSGNVTRAARLAQRNRTDFYKLMQRNHIVPTLFKE
jgi:two-component system response regulator GlrR